MKIFKFFTINLLSAIFPSETLANMPKPWQIGFQEAATVSMEKIAYFYGNMLYLVYGISIFVSLLLLYVCIRFRRSKNPIASQNAHNAKLEIAWTVLPAIILILIAVPSLKILYFLDKSPETEMTVKVIGHQWYWEYEYPLESSKIRFDSYIVKDKDLKEGDQRLLEVDNELVLPIKKNIKILVTAADVIHSWAIPSFGVKTDAVPGKVNETWININKTGIYYGQCSELCGVGHGFMPIKVRAVTEEDYNKWLEEAKDKYKG